MESPLPTLRNSSKHKKKLSIGDIHLFDAVKDKLMREVRETATAGVNNINADVCIYILYL